MSVAVRVRSAGIARYLPARRSALPRAPRLLLSPRQLLYQSTKRGTPSSIVVAGSKPIISVSSWKR